MEQTKTIPSQEGLFPPPGRGTNRLAIHKWVDHIVFRLSNILILSADKNVKALPTKYIIEKSEEALRLIIKFEMKKHDMLVHSIEARLIRQEEAIKKMSTEYDDTRFWEYKKRHRIIERSVELEAENRGLREAIDIIKNTEPTFGF